jgi:hypothetical protein
MNFPLQDVSRYIAPNQIGGSFHVINVVAKPKVAHIFCSNENCRNKTAGS